ncbi:MAG TPA: DNA polymerase III subunit delta' [Thermomicrobiales bacterium]
MRPDRGRWPVWGHDAAVASLRQAIVADRVRHAYLFAGPEGVGKTTLATAFAQALLCTAPVSPGEPCGECLACRKVARGVHPDIQTFSLERQADASASKGAKNTSLTIETVRELCGTAALRPMEGRWRIILLEDAETLQDVAQEALLKTLEEPPSFLLLILLSNDAEVLLPTIRSRCQIVELRPVPRAAIRDGLIATGCEPELAEELAGLAGGAPGWAIAASRNPALVEERRAAVARALDWIQSSGYERLVTAVRLGDSFSRRRAETFAELDTLLGVWRDALLLRTGHTEYVTFRGQAERLAELTREWPVPAIHRAVCSVQTCLLDLEANVRPRLAMEAMVLQWPTKHS